MLLCHMPNYYKTIWYHKLRQLLELLKKFLEESDYDKYIIVIKYTKIIMLILNTIIIYIRKCIKEILIIIQQSYIDRHGFY